jgi:hypothetical protein
MNGILPFKNAAISFGKDNEVVISFVAESTTAQSNPKVSAS